MDCATHDLYALRVTYMYIAAKTVRVPCVFYIYNYYI